MNDVRFHFLLCCFSVMNIGRIYVLLADLFLSTQIQNRCDVSVFLVLDGNPTEIR